MRFLLAPLSLFVLVSCGPAPRAEAVGDLEITDAVLAAITAESVPVLEDLLGAPFVSPPRVRVGNADEVEDLLVAENEAVLLRIYGEEVGREQTRTFARTLAPALVAKYAFREREVIVLPEAYPRLAELLEMPELNTDEALRAVVVHELVHAWDDQHRGLSDMLARADDAEEVLVFNAVIEGHAQFVARSACSKLGWSTGFDSFTRSIGAEPDLGLSEAERLIARLAASQLLTAYTDGEEFFGHVAEHAGAEGVARAFAEPPSLEEIFEPAWYLDPESRPALEFDLEGALELLEDELDEEDWQVMTMKANRAQLDVALGLLPDLPRNRVLDSLRQAPMRIGTWKNPLGDKQIVFGLYEFRSAGDAAFYLEAAETLSNLKDEQMKEGAIRIVESETTRPERNGLRGLHIAKKLKVHEQEVPVRTVVAHRDRLAAEVLYSNVDMDLDHVFERIDQLFTAALESAAEPERR